MPDENSYSAYSRFPEPGDDVPASPATPLVFIGNGGMVPYDIDVVNYLAQVGGLSYEHLLYFPEDGLSSDDPHAWQSGGAVQDPSIYWMLDRSQLLREPSLPTESNNGQRNMIVGEAVSENGLAQQTPNFSGGIATAFWGVSDYLVYEIDVPPTIQIIDPSLYTVISTTDGTTPNATVSVSDAIVTVTPIEGNTLPVIVELSLFSTSGSPGFYNGIAGAFEYGNCAGATMATDCVAMDGLTYHLPPKSSYGNQPKPVSGGVKYSGSWSEDWGQLQYTDIGTDSSVTLGESAAIAADVIAQTFQPVGTNGQWSYLVFTFTAFTDTSATFRCPSLVTAAGIPEVFVDQGGRQIVAYQNGPAFRWGCCLYFDPDLGVLDWPEQMGYSGSASILDAICFAENLKGNAATTNLSTIAASLYIFDVEYTQLKHLALDPATQLQDSHAFVMPIASDHKVRFALVGSWGVLPNPQVPPAARNIHQQSDANVGFTCQMDTWIQGAYDVVLPSSWVPPSLNAPTGDPVVTTTWISAPDGWQAFQYSVNDTDTISDAYSFAVLGTELATFYPWRGALTSPVTIVPCIQALRR